MLSTRLLTRALSNYTGHSSKPPKTALIIGMVCGIVVLGIGLMSIACKNKRETSANDPESLASRAQQRRENGGTWGPESPRTETAAERRRRNLEIRATMGGGSGVVSNPRRGEREEEAPPPVYQLPAPTYYASPELRRERLGQRPLPPLVGDAPPAYDSPAVWPTRT